MHVETSFVRNLGDLIRSRRGTPGSVRGTVSNHRSYRDVRQDKLAKDRR